VRWARRRRRAGGGSTMKAIIISDTDARALLDKLELTKLRDAGHFQRENPDKPPSMNEVHRVFHYVVCRWLQEQRADCVGR
jgi:hypothetical protein